MLREEALLTFYAFIFPDISDMNVGKCQTIITHNFIVSDFLLLAITQLATAIFKLSFSIYHEPRVTFSFILKNISAYIRF